MKEQKPCRRRHGGRVQEQAAGGAEAEHEGFVIMMMIKYRGNLLKF